MSNFQLVNVWTDPEPGPGGFNPMVASLLWLPDDYSIGHPTPAIVLIHRWGGYPYDPRLLQLGPQLAEQGFVVLSLALRRRGMEGQLAALPDNDSRDIKLAIDYLHTNGCSRIFLVGEELGGLSALRYMARNHDARVAGLGWIDPVPGPADWLLDALGKAAYDDAVRMAGVAVRQGAGMDVRIDLFPPNGPAITQQAMAFLSWWGPQAATGVRESVGACHSPLLLIENTSTEAPRAAEDYLQALTDARPATTCVRASASHWAEHITAWTRQLGADFLAAPALEVVHAGGDEPALFGVLWTPAEKQQVKTATMLIHGLSSSPLSPLFLKMAPVLAQSGTAVLAVELRRSGWAGHENSVLDNDVADLDRWIGFLIGRGYEKIVLAGASIGSISVGRYHSLRQNPNIVAVAHLMPTADCPDWFRRAAGEGPYKQTVAQAEAAIAAGRGDQELIDVDVRQPPPNKYGGRFRWTQRAGSWLSWWGPSADSRNTRHIANARVPLLLLSGTADSYNDEARFAELKAAAVNAPSVDEIWYPDIDHGLAGVEIQVARDLFAWMQRVGAVS